MRRIVPAAKRDQRVRVLSQWVAAAGGDVLDFGRDPIVRLPPDIPDCLALAELRRVARDLGLGVELGGRA